MRLIDADRMKKYMKDTTSKELMENEEVFEIIDEQPTISFGNVAELNWKKVAAVPIKEDGEEVFLVEGVSVEDCEKPVFVFIKGEIRLDMFHFDGIFYLDSGEPIGLVTAWADANNAD